MFEHFTDLCQVFKRFSKIWTGFVRHFVEFPSEGLDSSSQNGRIFIVITVNKNKDAFIEGYMNSPVDKMKILGVTWKESRS